MFFPFKHLLEHKRGKDLVGAIDSLFRHFSKFYDSYASLSFFAI